MHRSTHDRQTLNASSNASGTIFGAKLYLATGNQDYLDWAKGLYLWTKENLLDPDDFTYYESMNVTGEVNK